MYIQETIEYRLAMRPKPTDYRLIRTKLMDYSLMRTNPDNTYHKFVIYDEQFINKSIKKIYINKNRLKVDDMLNDKTLVERHGKYHKVEKLYQDLSECMRYINFYKAKDSEKVHAIYRRCKNKLCAACQTTRQFQITSNIRDYMKKNFNQKTDELHFLTITIRNTHDLKAGLKTLSDGWRRILQRKDFPYSGWVKSVEITLDKQGRYHPHYHILLVRSKKKDPPIWDIQKQWAPKLRESMQIDYTPSADIQKVDTSNDEIYNHIGKTIFYSTKNPNMFFGKDAQDLPKEQLLEKMTNFLDVTSKVRSISARGKFFKGFHITGVKEQQYQKVIFDNENGIKCKFNAEERKYEMVNIGKKNTFSLNIRDANNDPDLELTPLEEQILLYKVNNNTS